MSRHSTPIMPPANITSEHHIIGLPGTTQLDHLREDMAAAETHVSPEVLAQAAQWIHNRTVHGARYNPATQLEVDTEEF